MIDLSIVLPTCDRAALLERAIAAIADGTDCDYEIIVVDGASSDNTALVLERAKDRLPDRLRVIREDRREGFVRAANKGFHAAVGRNVTWLNDDARPRAGALDSAVLQMDSADSDVAFVAMFHRWHQLRNVAYETVVDGITYRLCHVRGTLYANFPVGRRETYQRLGCFDERFYVCAADPDLSLKAWNAGLKIVPGYDAVIDHDQTIDDRRAHDVSRAEQDNARLFAKWNLPPRNPFKNDFDPAHPCTLRGLRDSAIAA
jgi:GT2 family glycosyltransferase